MNSIQANPFLEDWRQLLTPLNQRPSAILMVSAHWCTRGTFISTAHKPKTVHDFAGFPDKLYQQQYPCPGAPDLLDKIHALGLDHIQGAPQQGLDHGAWMVLQQLFPEADIPCAQLSLDLTQNADYHWRLGQALAGLQDDNVLLIGSGNIVHNIAKWAADPFGDPSWAIEFDQAVFHALQQGDTEQLCHYQQLPFAHDAVPTAEHYLPLLYAQAFAGENAQLRSSNFAEPSLENASMRSLRFQRK